MSSVGEGQCGQWVDFERRAASARWAVGWQRFWEVQVGQYQSVVVGGLGLFGFAFAVNSSVHSYLVLAYAGSEKAAEDVGFYYAANALGRFLGTLLSGLLYQWGGLLYALVGSAVMLGLCWLMTLKLPMQQRAEPAGLS